MSVLSDLAAALRAGSIEIIDLTAPLSSETPILELPPEFGQTARFELEEISRYDDRGPGWYWNNFRTGEHTGTHFDAPNHWVTKAMEIDDVPVVVDFRVHRDAMVWPMVAAGTSNDDIKFARDMAPEFEEDDL